MVQMISSRKVAFAVCQCYIGSAWHLRTKVRFGRNHVRHALNAHILPEPGSGVFSELQHAIDEIEAARLQDPVPLLAVHPQQELPNGIWTQH